MFPRRGTTLRLCCKSWQTDCNTVKTFNREFLSISVFLIFVWNTDMMECKCRRYASASSFPKNLSKLLADYIWREKINSWQGRVIAILFCCVTVTVYNLYQQLYSSFWEHLFFQCLYNTLHHYFWFLIWCTIQISCDLIPWTLWKYCITTGNSFSEPWLIWKCSP
jgi:hypothetical protein